MRFPTIDETRAAISLISAVVLMIVLIYMVLSGSGSDDLIMRLIVILMTVTSGVNGIALAKRNSSGKNWGDPAGEKQDQLPEQFHD